MILSLPDMQALAATCAPAIAPETLLSVAQVESAFDPLAIGVNGGPRMTVRALNPADAAAKASALIAAGRSVDLGLAQINSRNLGWLDLTVETAFDPCRNLAAASRVLQSGFARGNPQEVGDQPALRTALSFYNTGNPERGLRNGYVTRVANAAARIVPAIQAPGQPDQPAPHPIEAQPPAWDVFGQTGAAASFVIHVSTLPNGGQE